MKILGLFIGTALLTVTAAAQPRIITVLQTQPDQTNVVSVDRFESVKILSAYSSGGGGMIKVVKDSASLRLLPDYNNPGGTWSDTLLQQRLPKPFVVSGPASVVVTGGGSPESPFLVTMELSPEAYPPSMAVTVGPGSGGAEITLQSSTNLVNWVSAQGGTYTKLTDATFFRIKANRIP